MKSAASAQSRSAPLIVFALFGSKKTEFMVWVCYLSAVAALSFKFLLRGLGEVQAQRPRGT